MYKSAILQKGVLAMNGDFKITHRLPLGVYVISWSGKTDGETNVTIQFYNYELGNSNFKTGVVFTETCQKNGRHILASDAVYHIYSHSEECHRAIGLQPKP